MFPSTGLEWINWTKESVVLLKYSGTGYVAHGCNKQSKKRRGGQSKDKASLLTANNLKVIEEETKLVALAVFKEIKILVSVYYISAYLGKCFHLPSSAITALLDLLYPISNVIQIVIEIN